MAIGELEQRMLLAILQLGDEVYGVTIAGVLREKAGRNLAMATDENEKARLDCSSRASDSNFQFPTPKARSPWELGVVKLRSCQR